MKKAYRVISLLIASLAVTASCTKNGDTQIITEVESTVESAQAESTIENKPYVPDGYEYLEGVGSWLSAEEEYKSYPDEKIDILFGNDFTPLNGNLYFRLSKKESKSDETGTKSTTGKPVYAYVSNATGEKHFLCPDPLCTHGSYSECQYLSLANLTASSSNDSVMYAIKPMNVKNISYSYIFEINTTEGTIVSIYTPDERGNGLTSISIRLLFEKDNTLYFVYKANYKTATKNGKAEYTEYSKLMSIDLSTQQTEVLNDDYSSYAFFVGQVDGKLLFFDRELHELYYTDMNFENPVTILKYGDEYGLYDFDYDEESGEMYALISYDELFYPKQADMSDVDIHCKIYKIGKDFTVTEVPMPSELILSMQLTKDYIYYKVYDPAQYGTRFDGRPLLDVSGGKIYRVKRGSTTEPELFFDGKGEFLFQTGYYVMGDNLYLTQSDLLKMGEDMAFYNTGSIARVNVAENTLKWINLY